MKFIAISIDEQGQIEKIGDMPYNQAHSIIELLMYQEAFQAGRESVTEDKTKQEVTDGKESKPRGKKRKEGSLQESSEDQ